jgi:hypothetical protein
VSVSFKYLKLYENFNQVQQPFYIDQMTDRLYVSDKIAQQHKAMEIVGKDGSQIFLTNIKIKFMWLGNQIIQQRPASVKYLNRSDAYLKQYNSIYKANRAGII